MPATMIPGLRLPTLWERDDRCIGADAFQNPAVLPTGMFTRLVNCIVDDKWQPQTRAGFDCITGQVAGTKIQGATYYDTPSLEQIVFATGDVMKNWNGTTISTVAGFTPTTGNDVEFAQLNNLIYLTDGAHNWQSYNGTTFTDLGSVAAGAGSPPVGATIACMHTKRMFASGQASNPDTIWASDFEVATQGHWDWGNFQFRVGGGEGESINALASLQDFWLAVGKANSLYMVLADPTAQTAADWTIRKLTSGIGVVGKRAHCVSGNDWLFLSRKLGVCSVKRMAATSDNFEVTPPLSLPMQYIVDQINWEHASTSVMWSYKHIVCCAVPLGGSTVPNYVMQYNRRTEQWNGHWTILGTADPETGIQPIRGITCAVVSRFNDVKKMCLGDNTGLINIWKDNDSRDIEATFLDNGVDIPTTIRSRNYVFGEPMNDKEGGMLQARFSNSIADVTVGIYYDTDPDLSEPDKTWAISTDVTQNQLPVDLGDFDLATDAPVKFQQPLVFVGRFNECTVELTSLAKKFALKNLTMSAFLKATFTR